MIARAGGGFALKTQYVLNSNNQMIISFINFWSSLFDFFVHTYNTSSLRYKFVSNESGIMVAFLAFENFLESIFSL